MGSFYEAGLITTSPKLPLQWQSLDFHSFLFQFAKIYPEKKTVLIIAFRYMPKIHRFTLFLFFEIFITWLGKTNGFNNKSYTE